MTSLANTAVTAVMQALQASPAVAGSVGRVQLRPVAKSVASAVVVRPVGASVLESSLPGAPIAWVITLAVECYARATAGTSPDEAVDPLVQSVYARLMADTSLGGAVNLIEPQDISFDFDVDGEQTACATLIFNLRQIAAPGIF
jgi:hypothetical protein